MSLARGTKDVRVDVLSILFYFTDVQSHTLYEHLILHIMPPRDLPFKAMCFSQPSISTPHSSPNIQVQRLMSYEEIRS